MNGSKEFVNSTYNADVEGGQVRLESAPASAPYFAQGSSSSSKMSPWVITWITFSTCLGIVGLILGAYATAEVNSINDTAKRSEQELVQIVSDSVFKASSDGSSVGKKVRAAAWTEHSDLDMARSDGGAVSYDNMVYVFGGLRLDDPSANPPGTILKSLVKYDPATREHTQLADMPGPRYRMAYAQMDGKIYVFGGFDIYDVPGQSDHSTPKSTMIYDIANDSWTDLGDTDNHMNVLRSDSCGAAANGKIYAFGGYEHQNAFQTSTAIEEFDFSTMQWRQLSTTLNHARGDCKAVTVGNNIHVLGGAEYASGETRFGVDCDNAGDEWQKCYFFSTVNERFVPATNTVSDMAPMNVGRGDLGVAVKPNGNILVAGGEVARPDQDEFRQVATDSVEEYDVASDTWAARAPLSQAKFRHGMTMAGNRILALGGHPTCTEGIVQCMQDALKSVVVYMEFPSLWLTEA